MAEFNELQELVEPPNAGSNPDSLIYSPNNYLNPYECKGLNQWFKFEPTFGSSAAWLKFIKFDPWLLFHCSSTSENHFYPLILIILKQEKLLLSSHPCILKQEKLLSSSHPCILKQEKLFLSSHPNHSKTGEIIFYHLILIILKQEKLFFIISSLSF